MVFLKEIADYSSFSVLLDQTWIDIDATSFNGISAIVRVTQARSRFLKGYNQLSHTQGPSSKGSPYSVRPIC